MTTKELPEVPTDLTQVEVTVDVFRLIRANDEMRPRNLWILIKEELSEIPEEMLKEAIKNLYERETTI